jgi:hypothetical protein
MTRPSQRVLGGPMFLSVVAMVTSFSLIDALAAQVSTVAPAAPQVSVQVTSGSDPGAIDRAAFLEAARQVLGRDVKVEDVRLGDLLDRLQAASSDQAANLPARWVLVALARSMTGYRGPIEEMRLGEFLNRLRPLEVRTAEGQRVVDGSGLVDLARGWLGPVGRVDHAADPLRSERSALQLSQAAAATIVAQVRRDGFGQGDRDAVYEEARRRLLESEHGDAARLLDGLRWIEEEVAAAAPQPTTRAEEIAVLQSARVNAFGPQMAGLLFSRDAAMERFELDRLRIEADPKLTDLWRAVLLRARREALRVEMAAEGTLVGFVDSVSAAAPADGTAIPSDAPVSSAATPVPLATTSCDTDPNAVPFEPTVTPALLNTFLKNNPNVAVSKPFDINFGGVCVDHHLHMLMSAAAATQNSSFLVTPSPGALQVLLNLGALSGTLAVQTYDSTGCATLCPQFLCDTEESLLRTVVEGADGTVSASSVQITQTADICVLGDCTAVHPLDSTFASMNGFRMELFGSCNHCVDPCPFFSCEICVNPCSGLDSAITGFTNWLVDISGLLAKAMVNPDGSGTLIDIFSSGIVSDGCLPISEVTECRRAGAQAPTLAGLARPPKGRGASTVLYFVPLLVAVGAIVGLRRRRKA